MNASMITLDSTCGNGSSIEENFFSLSFKQSSIRKGRVINTSVGEYMSKETESRRPSPSVIAKLMGLDELPPPQVGYKQQKDIGSFHNSLCAGFEEKYVSDEDISHQMRTDGHQEFKDVFEIMETSNTEMCKKQLVQKKIPISTHNDTDLDLKHFSTDEAPHNSKGFNDVLDVEDIDGDHFRKFLQEPNSLFMKHLRDPRYSPLPSQYGSNEVCRQSENKADRCAYLQKDVTGTFRNTTTNPLYYSLKQNGDSHLYRFPSSENASEVEMYLHPSEIVIMKPCLDKGQNTERNFPLPRYPGTGQFGYRGHREFWTPGIPELYAERRNQHKLFTNAEFLENKTKSSSEVTKEITKQMRNRVTNITRKEFASRFDGNVSNESLCRMVNVNKDGAFQQTSNPFDDWNSSYTPSSSYSDGSSEARKSLSEYRKIIHSLQRRGLDGGNSYAMGEMLALSDRETSRKPVYSWNARNTLDEKLAIDVALETKNYPSNFNNRDDREAACSINLPRSVSQSASSSGYRSPKSSSRPRDGNDHSSNMLKDMINLESDHPLDGKTIQKRSSLLRSVHGCSNKLHFLKSGWEENDKPVQVIFVNPEEGRKNIVANNLAEEMPILTEVASSMVADTGLAQNFAGTGLAQKILLAQDRNATVPTLTNQKHVGKPANIISTTKDGNSFATSQNDVTVKEKSNDQTHVDSLSSHCDEIESESLVSSKEVEQPSPVSVLEPLSEEEKYSSGCFRSVAANLQELRMQVELLILESEDRHTKEFKEDAREENQTLPQMEELFSAFRDEEDRDFSYLVDMLIYSGIRDVYQDKLFGACYSSEYPVCHGVFEKLEKMYGMLETWLRSERELLFELINSSLAEILAPCMDVQPWLGLKGELVRKCARLGLVEELWQRVVRKRKELSVDSLENMGLELSWRNLGDDFNFTGREIAGMLIDDILEDFVSKFILG